MKNIFNRKFLPTVLLAAAGILMAASPASAVVTYNQGDLLMGFRQTGTNNSVVINIGQASQYRDASSSFSIDVGNLGALLTDNFGAGWASDPTVFWGVIGSPSAVAEFNGDPSDTVYASRDQTTFGTQSTPWPNLLGSRGGASSLMVSTQTGLGGFSGHTEAPGSTTAIEWSGAESADWQERMLGSGGVRFTAFNGSLESSFDSGAAFTGLDLYRFDGARSYEGTFHITAAGVTTFTPPVAVPEPSRLLLLGCGISTLLFRRRRVLAKA